MLGSLGRSPRARVAITHRGQGPRRAPLIEVSWMVCQYSTRSLVSTEKHETTPETGMEGRGGHTAGVGTVTVVMGGYYPLPRSLTAINRPANSARVLRSRTCGRWYLYDALLERLPQDLEHVTAGTPAVHPERAYRYGRATRRPASAPAPHRSARHRRWCGRGRDTGGS
jgi:hypothetical protein